MSGLVKFHRLLLRAENLILLVLLLAMVLVAVLQIVLRNLVGGGLLWADAFTRTSVLWLALLGAMLASRRQQHIAIDVLAQRVPGVFKRVVRGFAQISTALICMLAAWFGLELVRQEYGYGDMAFAGVPNWWCQSIIPFAFAVIALRYAVAVFIGNDEESL